MKFLIFTTMLIGLWLLVYSIVDEVKTRNLIDQIRKKNKYNK